MSLARMRRWSRVVAVMLVLATAHGTPHFAQDDVACDLASLALAQHDESRHAFRSSGDNVDGDHCAVCHWTRTLRSPLTPLDVRLATLAAAHLVYRPTRGLVPVAVHEALPARAPPSALL